MCQQGCRTFAWGGMGVPTHDGDGGCFCACESDSWSNLNILGLPSCVPVKAHLLFGWFGLVISVVTLSHAAYHFRRQLTFHRHHTSALNSPIERCRKQFHIGSLVLGTLTICYSIMLLENRLQRSAVLWTFMQIPTNIVGIVLSTRMWIYTNDRRLMRKCPKILAISGWLERRRGRYVTFGCVSIAPVMAIFLQVTDRTEMGIALVLIALCIMTIIVTRTFFLCGKSLMDAINASLEQQQLQRRSSKPQSRETVTTTAVHQASTLRLQDTTKGSSQGDRSLLTARKKVKGMLILTVFLGVSFECLLLFDVCSGYGVAAPLLMFVAPLVLCFPVWICINIQLHAGRSKAWGSKSSRLHFVSNGSTSAWAPKLPSMPRLGNPCSRCLSQPQVVPTEVSTTTPC